MRLNKYIELHAPFTSKEKVDDLLKCLKARKTILNNELTEKLCCLCNEDNLPYMKEQLSIYVEHYRGPSRPPKIKAKKKVTVETKQKTNSTRDYYQKNFPDSLAAKGYDYGLSDW